MATDKAIELARQQLRMKIFRLLELASFDRPGKLAQAVHPIFAEVLDALEDLDDGEVPLAFSVTNFAPWPVTLYLDLPGNSVIVLKGGLA